MQKNEALQLIAATLLKPIEVTLRNIPDIGDIRSMLLLYKTLGGKAEYDTSTETLVLNSYGIQESNQFSQEYEENFSSIRASIMFVGPLLSRFNEVLVPDTGGDNIGQRSLAAHLEGFEALGCKTDFGPKGRIISYVSCSRRNYELSEISVTASANLLMLACGCNLELRLENVAIEPYVVSLSELLIKLGYPIEGIGSNVLNLYQKKNQDNIKDVLHVTGPDFIEASGIIALSVATRSNIIIKGISLSQLGKLVYFYKYLGVNIVENDQGVYVDLKSDFKVKKSIDNKRIQIYDAPWPGLSPDVMSTMLVSALFLEGVSIFHQKMFEGRLFFTDRLIRMGADIILCDPHRAIIIGNRGTQLKSSKMSSPDIRAGMALVIAAITADGESEISNFYQVERGYSNLVRRLTRLGVSIEKSA
ncbi:UDP-N-acetylglucosamine 1-carboxyvinyltransferase [Schleiferiaceae bacterium]|nr:UDP-N-acetylglucosamine 1-carboxyvinyltransferase [Schleiferiaceae bacterium]